MSEKGAVVSKQQISDEFLDGFRACEETLKVEETAICSETDVDAAWQVVFCLTEHDADEGGELCCGQNASLCLKHLDMEKLPDRDPTSPDVADLHGAGGGW